MAPSDSMMPGGGAGSASEGAGGRRLNPALPDAVNGGAPGAGGSEGSCNGAGWKAYGDGCSMPGGHGASEDATGLLGRVVDDVAAAAAGTEGAGAMEAAEAVPGSCPLGGPID